MTATVPRFAELHAPPAWREVDFISDLHLQASEPRTFEAWRAYMASTPADAIFILGDLFELWVGDDAAREPGFASDCAAVIHAAALRVPVFVMHGNRDFLMGDGFISGCGATLLGDPSVLTFAGVRWLLTHGDLLCIADTEYLRFREQVRGDAWQREFLARPLADRLGIGRTMRDASETRKRSAAEQAYAPVDEPTVLAWLDAADATAMIHGHTHLPADHDLPQGRRRIVLSDWDADASPPRLQALRVSIAGARRIPLD